MPSWNAYAHSEWCHKYLSPANLQCGPYQCTLQVVPSVWASCRRTWNSTHLLVVMFGAPPTSTSAAGCIWASFLTHVFLRPVTLVTTSYNRCHLRCWNNLSKRLAFNRYHLMDFALQSLFCTLPISIWPCGCHLSGPIQAHLKLPSFCCCNLFCSLHLDLHCSPDYMNLLSS